MVYQLFLVPFGLSASDTLGVDSFKTLLAFGQAALGLDAFPIVIQRMQALRAPNLDLICDGWMLDAS